jgi:hypothetical protein
MGADPNPSQVARGLAAVRAAEALLRTLGGGTVYVRIPTDIISADDATQLGLQAVATEDIELSPAVARALRKTKDSPRKMELSISAASLSRAKDIQDANGAEQFFDAALGVIYAEKLWRIESVAIDDFGGMPYLYRLIVAE